MAIPRAIDHRIFATLIIFRTFDFMLRTSLAIALRIFAKDPRLALLTILTLALSLSISFLLWQHASYELASDSFHKDADRIVRGGLVMRWSDDHATWEEAHIGINTPGLIKRVSARYAEITDFTRILHQQNFNQELIIDHGKQVTITINGQAFAESNMIYGDPNLFPFFGISLAQGDPETVLDGNTSVVLSKATALQYFGDSAVIGKNILLNDTIALHVTGVFEDLPQNSHLDFDLVVSSKRIESLFDDKLHMSVGGPHCYLKLKEGVNPQSFAERMNDECSDLLATAMYNNPFRTLSLYLQPLSDVPFSLHRLDAHHPESRYFLQMIRYASWIILLVGLTNYINLMISLTGFRLKEFAVKKTVGATLRDFLWQFAVESAIVHVIAITLALIIMFIIKVPAQLLLNFHITSIDDISAIGWITITGTLLASVLISSLYPAFIFYRLGPSRLFRFARVYNSENFLLKALSIFQYTSALIMLLVTFMISHQLYFVMYKGLGIKTEHSIVIDLSPAKATPSDIGSFVNTLRERNILREYTACASIPGDYSQSITGLKRSLNGPTVFIETNGAVDANFITFFDLKIVAGRNFKSTADEDQLILTEGAMQRLGFNDPAEAAGQTLFTEQGEARKIVGIVSDYKLKPVLKMNDYLFYEGNTGVVLYHPAARNNFNASAKLVIRPQDTKSVEDVHHVYDELFPGRAFISYDLDSVINKHYDNYQTSRNQFIFFLLVTMFIAVIGLYAFIALKTGTKSKEIGVRKILGANVWGILVFLLRSSFLQMILSVIIAVPSAVFISRQYFQDFEEHIQFNWYHFVIPVAVFFIIASVPIVSMVFRAAKENPTESIKYE
jgi:putative ABC transport system permease protein